MRKIYQVDKDGKAPSNVQPGDYVATGGGTYQILDPANYAGMSKSELAKIGVGFNETSGLYSKKVTDPTDPYYANTGDGGTNYKNLMSAHTGVEAWDPLTYDNAQKWKDQYIQQQTAQLQSNYDNALAQLQKNYNKNVAAGEQELTNVDNEYADNLDSLYDDAYLQRKLAVQNASRNGITSTAQAQAASNSLLWKATDTAADLTSDRDALKSNIHSELNRIAEDYNIDKSTLKKEFDSAKLNALSTADLQYLESVLKIDQYNTDLWNSLTAAKAERDWNAAEAQKDRDFKLMLEQMFGNSYGGNYSGSKEDDVEKGANILQTYLEYDTGWATDEEKSNLAVALEKYKVGRMSFDDWIAYYNALYKNTMSRNSTPVNTNTTDYSKYNISQIR